MKPTFQSKAYVRGALTLTIAALITKILSAIYRIPFQNIVGDVGFYIYQQVYPFYGVALVLCTYGFPVVISKLYTERENNHDSIGIQALMLVSTTFIFLLGVVVSLILYYGADYIAASMNDRNLSILIRVIAVVFLIVPFVAVLRGYFQGAGNMLPTAYSQVGEQFVRVSTILFTAILLTKEQHNLYIVGAGAVFGSITGGIVSLVVLITFIWVKRDKKAFIDFHQILNFNEIKSIVSTLITQGFAVCVSSLLLIFMQLADALNLYSLLITSGINGEGAKSLKGIYDRGQPLIQLGSVVATSMALAIVPLITSEKLKSGTDFLYRKIQLALQISLTIGLGATVGLMTIIEPTNTMLFKNTDGSDVLALLSLMILISSVIITVVAILQGLGYMTFPAVIVLSGFFLKYFLNIWMVPLYGTLGAAFASNGALCLIAIILIIKLYVVVKQPLFSLQILFKTIMAAFVMFLVLKGYLWITDFLYRLGDDRMIASLQSLSAAVLGGCTYVFFIIQSKVFTAEELQLLPFGSKLNRLFPKKNRR